MRVCYLCCADTITSSLIRRADAFEHDREFQPLKAAFEAAGDTLMEADWRHPLPNADLYFIRTVWDYPDHFDAFMTFLDQPEIAPRLANPPEIVKANISKTYLKDLAAAGVPVMKSHFPTRPQSAMDLWAHTGVDDLVVKAVIGAGSAGQYRLIKGQSDEASTVAPGYFVQPFMPEIQTIGEHSLIFFNGCFSHACRKTNPTGDYRIQSLYGGVEEPYQPTDMEIDIGAALIATLPSVPLACRIDLLPSSDGPLVMELEAIEPYLYPDFCPDFGTRLHAAIQDYIKKQT